MTNNTTDQLTKQPFDPVQFGIEVQALATSIEQTPAGEELSREQMQTAEHIASLFATHRKEALAEFTKPAESSVEVFGIDVKAPVDLTQTTEKRIAQEAAKKQLRSAATQLDNDETARVAVGDWLRTLPPDRRYKLNGDTVLDSMFAYKRIGSLVFSDVDHEVADAVIGTAERVRKQEAQLEEKLSDPTATQVAASDILHFMVAHAETPFSKVAMKSHPELLTRFAEQFFGISREQVSNVFDSAWSYLQTFFADLDDSYKLFRVGSRTKGTTYTLNDPEFALELWKDEHGDMQEQPQLQPELEQPKNLKVVSFNPNNITYQDGHQEQVSPIAEKFYLAIQELGHNKWESRVRLAGEIAKQLGLKKSDVELELKQLEQKLGKDMLVTAYSRRGNRVLVTRGKGWK